MRSTPLTVGDDINILCKLQKYFPTKLIKSGDPPFFIYFFNWGDIYIDFFISPKRQPLPQTHTHIFFTANILFYILFYKTISIIHNTEGIIFDTKKSKHEEKYHLLKKEHIFL